ncbi:magnesium chelatase subunit D [Limimaricola sp.]|uniref:magnesium chelatase subunit D n=1 Tax=Limimaricola sp. TaxID=2211665 RepID=UPI0025C5663A|nr:magnesium chelatase subunit D [Limimaricola sp.]
MAETAWSRATAALTLLAVDPTGLGGLVLRARAGPVRDRFTTLLPRLPLPLRRLHPAVGDDALFGGLDLSGTLASGHLVQSAGVLARPAALVLAMAERCTPSLAARLAGALDAGQHCLVALDEGGDADEGAPPTLAERCAFHADLTEVALGEAAQTRRPDIEAARARLSAVTVPGNMAAQVADITLRLGIDSLRAALFTLRAARAQAALKRHDAVTQADLELACQLVLAHRATQVPVEEEPPEPPEPPPQETETEQAESPLLPEELLLEAVRALLPPDLLDRLRVAQARNAKGAGTGAARKGNRRGRPLPSRVGRPRDGARIDLVATLRAAAPWQTIRARHAPAGQRLHIRAEDIHLRRFEERSDRLLIFTVDASGSAALARLAEAKGAVELLLAQAYARRDHVCLIAFRGTTAEVLLPPTRSLVQTKRRLAGLPGGGGTPLAAGLQAALLQAGQAQRHGLTPTIALLTDGRANIALDGSADRTLAASDAQRMAVALRAAGVDSIVIDTGNRPEPGLRELAARLGGPYLALPRADAERLSAAVSDMMEG